MCWYTPCTPQKQPPAITAVWTPSEAWASTAGAGMITASSAAREGATAKADNRQRADGGGAERKAAEVAAGHGVSSGVGGFDGSLGGAAVRNRQRLRPMPQIRAGRNCYRRPRTSS